MKKLLFVFLPLFFGFQTAHAHNLWLETEGEARVGKSHEVRIYYGEYTYDYYESVSGNFEDVADFTLWLVKPGGEKVELEANPAGETFYSASFTPDKKGTYQLLLVSDKVAVVDWSDYGLGVLKPNFYASAVVQVEGASALTAKVNEAPLVITPKKTELAAGDTLRLQVSFRGEPVAEQEIILSVADQWTKTVQTNENGKVRFALPWQGQYVMEAVYTEEAPGHFAGDAYETVRHTSTFTLIAE